jgi:WD40 repeat protein
MLASASYDHTIRVWDVARGEMIAILEGHTNRINSVHFSPADSILASGSDDQTIRLWRAPVRRDVPQDFLNQLHFDGVQLRFVDTKPNLYETESIRTKE